MGSHSFHTFFMLLIIQVCFKQVARAVNPEIKEVFEVFGNAKSQKDTLEKV